MKIPFYGRVSYRLVQKLYKQKPFYHVTVGHAKQGSYTIVPCKLSENGTIQHPFIWKVNEAGICTRNYRANWSDLFADKTEAEREANRRRKLYTDGFYKEPFVTLETLENHKEQLLHIEATIGARLTNYPNFKGIDFCDVSAGGIQIRGYHKEIEHYTYGQQPTIQYDFSNVNAVINKFVTMWKSMDNPKTVNETKFFLHHGEATDWK